MTAGEKDRIVVGTGPYVAEKVTDTEIDLKKNAHYWGKVQPKLDKIIVRSITDGDALSMAMQSGELDAAQGLPYASLSNFQDTNKYKISSAATSRVYQALMIHLLGISNSGTQIMFHCNNGDTVFLIKTLQEWI